MQEGGCHRVKKQFLAEMQTLNQGTGIWPGWDLDGAVETKWSAGDVSARSVETITQHTQQLDQ